MASVRFSLSKKQPVNGKVEVLCRFMAGHPYDFNARTQLYVPVDRWDVVAENISVSTRYVNADTKELLSLRDKVNDLRRFILEAYMVDPASATSRKWLLNTINSFHHPDLKQTRTLQLHELIPMYVESCSLTDGTIRQYQVLERMLVRYEEKIPLPIEELTCDDLDEIYDSFFKERKRSAGGKLTTVRRGRNTVVSKMKKLRAICFWACKRGLMNSNPFVEFDMPSEVYGTPTFLTLEELRRVECFENLSRSLAVQRDIFVFQCHVGCRVSDLLSLKHDNVVCKDGVRVLQYIQEKLKASRPITIQVPLDDVASRLVDKYEHVDIERLFPFISSVHYNESIKMILERAGIDRVVIVQDPTTLEPVSRRICDIASSHLARRTFAGNLFKSSGSERIVSSMTGHSPGSRAFNRYTNVDDDMKLKALQSLVNPA